MNHRRFLVWMLLLALVLPVKLFATDSTTECELHTAPQTQQHDCCDSEQHHCPDFQCGSCAGCTGGASTLPMRCSQTVAVISSRFLPDGDVFRPSFLYSELLRPPRA